MSSMRNAVQRRNHKERAQPEERKKWGLLEKRKDYKLRAADHRQKKAKLKILSEKARDRNPDEFSFKMMSSSVDNKGRKVADRGNEALSMDVVKLLKTQDSAYIRTMLQQVRRERQKLEERLVLEDQEVRTLKDGSEEKQGKHRVFVENEEEQEEFDADKWFGEGRAMPTASRLEVPAAWEDDEDEDDDEDDDEEEEQRPQKKTPSAKKLREQAEKVKQMKKFDKTRSRAQSRTAFRLQMVKKKERELVAAEEELEKQRAKMNNSVGGINKNGVKFKIRERKR
ncbi:U3 small nucleolar RNA-associated protein 11 [Didymella exigua CBS 183.55]|uniref:U3 small nucleolar RNA-associated protein 11 n=1 Tax=Didymella exigua CBS 183.55 TaxID=1150837 RepID=A0A6A5RF35_9PLEO|nr:U3 small nucleolar RNA-associated protein 11 [Didymella exigua CBS 183.55]KAF1926312.1 U3 small nucleolar RNA-associated protein 11 [Didymella exigua CBS 183.55]